MATELKEKEKQEADCCSIFRSYEGRAEWEGRAVGLSRAEGGVFLREMEVGKVVIEVSFSIRPTYSGNIVILTLLTLFKTALSNVSESQIKLSRFVRKDLVLGELTGQLADFYRRELFKEIYKIPGSINLLGNPYVFIKYLAEGAWEVLNQPSEGFIKGPIEGGVGVLKGGVYFLRNVVAGTFNSLEVISESCSRGVAYLTFDEKFITRREKIQMQKSRHVGQGAKSALFALYTGFEVAVTGVVRHPLENYRRTGLPGFLKGLLQGTTGLLTKPLSGLFEAVSKFSEGVKQTALFFQDGPNSTRSRPPRIFISSQEYYEEYNAEESKAINLLEFHSTKHLKKTILLVAVDPSPQDALYTVLTSEYLVLLSKATKKVLREVSVEDIREVEVITAGEQDAVRVRVGDHDEELILHTHKSRELYLCFKAIFEHADDQQDDEDEEEQL